MSYIKSSYELAMERLKDIPPDAEGLRIRELREKGKRLFASLRKDKSFDLQAHLPEGPELVHVRSGLVEVLLANIVFPSTEEHIANLAFIRKGFSACVHDRNMLVQIFAQLEDFAQHYLHAYKDLESSLTRRFSELFRQQSRALEKKYGHSVQMDPSTSPEFITQLRKSREQLQKQHERGLQALKDELRHLSHG